MGNPAGKSKCGGQTDESAHKRTPGSKTSAREYRCATELGKPAMFSQDGSIGGAAPLIFPAVDDDPRTRNFVLKDGHSKVVGTKDSTPQKLIEFLQEHRILAKGPRFRDWRGHFAIAAPAGDPADAWLW